jgi:hypothetical protein
MIVPGLKCLACLHEHAEDDYCGEMVPVRIVGFADVAAMSELMPCGCVVDQSLPRVIELTKGKVALVDAIDYNYIMQWKWHAGGYGGRYAARKDYGDFTGPTKHVTMHGAIGVLMGLGKDVVDHVNGDGFDNRRSNLRAATVSENMCNRKKSSGNTSGFTGVVFRKGKKTKQWRAQIGFKKKHIALGDYDTPEEASLVYQEKARELFGEFVRCL